MLWFGNSSTLTNIYRSVHSITRYKIIVPINHSFFLIRHSSTLSVEIKKKLSSINCKSSTGVTQYVKTTVRERKKKRAVRNPITEEAGNYSMADDRRMLTAVYIVANAMQNSFFSFSLDATACGYMFALVSALLNSHKANGVEEVMKKKSSRFEQCRCIIMDVFWAE